MSFTNVSSVAQHSMAWERDSSNWQSRNGVYRCKENEQARRVPFRTVLRRNADL